MFVVAKPIGSSCNLRCRYCFYLGKDHVLAIRNEGMPGKVLETYIRQKIEGDASPEIFFIWQGGEPALLGLNFFRELIRLQKKYSDGRPIRNALQTNGTLLDDRWCSYLSEADFLVGVSLDGPRTLHDAYRLDAEGNSSFDRVMDGIEALARYKIEYNLLACIHNQNARQPLEVYRFLRDVGEFIQLIPVVERLDPANGRLIAPGETGEYPIAPWSVHPEEYGRFLITVFDEWVKRDVGRVSVNLFEFALESWVGIEAGVCIFRETCGLAAALEQNGDLYSCDHYVFPQYELGNILETDLKTLIHSEKQIRFGKAKREGLPDSCRRCPYRFACHGECPKNRFVRTQEGEYMNYLCPAYRAFFQHIDPAMKKMAEELRSGRAPANIMKAFE